MPAFPHQVKCPFCEPCYGVESHLSIRYNRSQLGYFICDNPACGRRFRLEDQGMFLVYYEDLTEKSVLTLGHLTGGVVRPGAPTRGRRKP